MILCGPQDPTGHHVAGELKGGLPYKVWPERSEGGRLGAAGELIQPISSQYQEN